MRVNGDEEIINPLNFVKGRYIFPQSELISDDESTKGIRTTYLNHKWSITMQKFNNTQYLKSFPNMIATANATTLKNKIYSFYSV